MTQGELFAGQPRAHARRTDPHTSHEAAASVTRIRESQRFILSVLQQCGPMVDEVLVKQACNQQKGRNMSVSGIRTRRSELVRLGLVRNSGKRRLPSGRLSIIWRAV